MSSALDGKINATRMGQTNTKLSPRPLKLGVYEEVVGRIKQAKLNDGIRTLLIEIPPVLLAVEIPADSLVGDIPPRGTLIGLLRTKTDFRIKTETDGIEAALEPHLNSPSTQAKSIHEGEPTREHRTTND